MDSKHIVIDARIRRSSTGRYVDRLIEHLEDIDSKNTYTVLLQPDDPWTPKASNFMVTPSKYAQFSLNPLDQLGFARQLSRLKPDLVHFPMNQQPVLFRGTVVTSTLDTTMLDYTRPGKSSLVVFKLKMFGYRFLFWYSHKKSKAIITISNYVKGQIEDKYSFTRGKITVTPCASEPPMPDKPAKPARVNEPFILYVGTAFPHKNLENLIKTFEIIKTSQPELNLALAGKREYYYEELEKFAADSPAKDSIIFTGFVSDPELKWLYQNALSYVFPSLSEGFGLPGLEAMVHGCPVVSSKATCLPEVYGEAAVYFDPLNVSDMADKISQVISDSKLRQELIQKGRDQAAKYSWRRMAEQTLDVYRQALAKDDVADKK